MRRFDLMGGIIWFVLALLVALESFRLGVGEIGRPDAGLFPLLTAILLGFFSLLLFLESLMKKEREGCEKTPVWPEDTNWKNIVTVVVTLTAYALILEWGGFLLTTFGLILYLFKAIEPQRWTASFIGAGVTVWLSYLVFQVWLQSQLPEGRILVWLKMFL